MTHPCLTIGGCFFFVVRPPGCVCVFVLQFNQYIRKYLMMYPDTAEADIPRFEDFDLNRDGMVTFDEWQMYLDHHRQVSCRYSCLRLFLYYC